jgi:hypothetical protein
MGSRKLKGGNLSQFMATEHGIPATQDLSNNPVGGMLKEKAKKIRKPRVTSKRTMTAQSL